MKTAKKKKTAATGGKKKNIAASYNKFKLFDGQQYTGVKIGRGHKWNYDKGIWLDKKITPEKWIINYEVKKSRAGKAPEGSGAPIGTEYHWYIMARQVVKKLDSNTYSTKMDGVKFKLAHKRFDKDNWNVSEKSQRKKLIKFLQSVISELENETENDKNLIEEKITPKKTPSKKKSFKKKFSVPLNEEMLAEA